MSPLLYKTPQVELTHEAQKSLSRVPAHIALKLSAWVEAVKREGLEIVRKIPGYHDEPLKGNRLGQRSIRLSRSYGAIYEVICEEPVIVQVQEVTKHDY